MTISATVVNVDSTPDLSGLIPLIASRTAERSAVGHTESSIARRDTGIIKLNTSAGDPPTAVTLLERFAAINNRQAMRELLEEGRNWCATVRQSHTSHPSLIYFQSVGTGAGWPAALGALLDTALYFELCLDEPDLFGPAVLLGQDGTRMARELAAVISLAPKEGVTDGEEQLRETAARLARCGYPVRANPDYAAMAKRRAEYRSCVEALAEHLGKPSAMLIPGTPAP